MAAVRMVAVGADGRVEDVLEPGNPFTATGKLRATVAWYLTKWIEDGREVRILPVDPETGKPVLGRRIGDGGEDRQG